MVSIKFRDECVDAYSGQTNMCLRAYADEQFVGRIDYVIFGDDVSIHMIEVLPGHLGNGYGTLLVQQLQRQFPQNEINWGMLTDDGAKLYEALPKRIEVNPEIQAMNEELQEKKTQLKSLQKVCDEFYALTNVTEAQRSQFLERAASMNEVDFRVEELSRALYGKKDTKTFIVLPEDIAPTGRMRP